MLTHVFANKVLNAMTARTNTAVASGETFVGLSYTNPTRAGSSFTEPGSNTGYARVRIGLTSQNLTWLMGAAADGECKNLVNIHFPKALINYPTPVTYFLIFNGSSELMGYGQLTNPIQPIAMSIPVVEANNLVLTLE